ncbi:MAG TPA: outer membrane beta-barrel protein [Sphingomonadaceae bacterium]|nr:outer membrane beta-barrel protein [Sphingomonadaceae bacterium]
MSKTTTLKYLIAASTLAIFATPGIAHAEGFDGPYAGIQGGIEILNSEGSTIAGPFDDSDSQAMVGGVLGLRGSLTNGFVVGAEGDLGFNIDSGDARYGISAIAGAQLGESSLLYGRVGYGFRDGLPADTGEGLVLGGGFETLLSDSLGLRLDYKHIDLGGIDLTDNTVDYSSHEITAGAILSF